MWAAYYSIWGRNEGEELQGELQGKELQPMYKLLVLLHHKDERLDPMKVCVCVCVCGRGVIFLTPYLYSNDLVSGCHKHRQRSGEKN